MISRGVEQADMHMPAGEAWRMPFDGPETPVGTSEEFRIPMNGSYGGLIIGDEKTRCVGSARRIT